MVENDNLPHKERLIPASDLFDFLQNGFFGFSPGRNQGMYRDAKGFRFRADRKVGGLEDIPEAGGQKMDGIVRAKREKNRYRILIP